jgi:hypothetical protein
MAFRRCPREDTGKDFFLPAPIFFVIDFFFGDATTDLCAHTFQAAMLQPFIYDIFQQ